MAETELNGGVETQDARDERVYEAGLRLGILSCLPKFARFMYETDRIEYATHRNVGGFLSAMKLSGGMVNAGFDLVAAFDAWNVGPNQDLKH